MQNSKYSYNMPGLLGDPLSSYYNQQRTLPNEGGSYSLGQAAQGGGSMYGGITDPNFELSSPAFPQGGGSMYGGITDPNFELSSPAFPQGQNPPAFPQGGGADQSQGGGADQSRSKYINPKTGDFFETAEEYGAYVGSRLPKTGGDIGKYAGDVLMNQARGLNNARNDIATGTTDPYDITQGGKVVFSPQDREAIQKAYAGVYDPALDDVFARLKTAEEEKRREQDREDMRYSTDESIRQWRATTGTKPTSGSKPKSVSSLGILRGEDGYVNWSEYIAKAREWEDSGKSMEEFVDSYPPNDFINPSDVNNLPSYLKPKVDSMSSHELDVLIRQGLSDPANQALPDETKASWIMSMGGDPEKFGIYVY